MVFTRLHKVCLSSASVLFEELLHYQTDRNDQFLHLSGPCTSMHPRTSQLYLEIPIYKLVVVFTGLNILSTQRNRFRMPPKMRLGWFLRFASTVGNSLLSLKFSREAQYIKTYAKNCLSKEFQTELISLKV